MSEGSRPFRPSSMGDAKKRSRVLKRARADDAFDKQHGVILNLVAEVVFDLSDEVGHLKALEQDQAFCAELHYRMENGASYGDPDLVKLNGEVLLFVAMCAVNVWSGAVRRDSSLRREGIDVVAMQLRADGHRMARGMRARLGKQVKKMRYRF